MALPTLTLLESFKRANESPLNNGGKWVILNGATAIGALNAEKYTSTTSGPPGFSAAYWTPTTYRHPAAAAELSGILTNAKEGFLYAALQTPTTSARSGYRLMILFTAVSGTKATARIEKITEGTPSLLVEIKNIATAIGDLFALSVEEGGKVRCYHKVGAGEWTLVTEAADETWTEGYIGIGATGLGAVGLRNFEGGGVGVVTANLTATQTQAPSFSRALTRALSITQAQTASLSGIAAGLREPTTTQASAASLKRSVKRALKATATPAPTLVGEPITPELFHELKVTQSSHVTLKGLVKHKVTLTTTGQGSAAHVTEISGPTTLHTLKAQASPAALALRRSVKRHLSVTHGATVTLSSVTKVPTKVHGLTVSQSSSATLSAGPRTRVILVTQGSQATLTRARSAITLFVTQPSSARLKADATILPKMEVEEVVTSGRVPTNRVTGASVTPEEAPPEEEKKEGVGSLLPQIALQFFAELERPAGTYYAIWSCLQAPAHSGYRMVMIPPTGKGSYTVHLEKWVAGTMTLLGSATVTLSEWVPIELDREGGNVVASVSGSPLISAADATYTEGHGGIEAKDAGACGGVSFTQGGELLDDFKRAENPLAGAHWHQLPWSETIGQLANEIFGYIATAAEANSSGAYWS